MAILRRDGKAVNLSRGLYRGNVKDFNSRGLKKTKKGDIFECGNLEILLKNGVSLSQYIMVSPYDNYLFYKFVKAVGLEDKIYEYVDFPFFEMFDKEIVLELDYESVRGGRYLNVINVYSLEEAEEFIQYQEARDELKRRNVYIKTITFKYKTNNFENHTRSRSLNYYTNDFNTIYKVAKDIINDEKFISPIRLIGITVSSIKEEKIEQLKLF